MDSQHQVKTVKLKDASNTILKALLNNSVSKILTSISNMANIDLMQSTKTWLQDTSKWIDVPMYVY